MGGAAAGKGSFFQAASEKRTVQRMDATNRMLSASVIVSVFSSVVDCFFSITFLFFVDCFLMRVLLSVR